MAIAIASATSSGLGIVSRFIMSLTIFCTAFLSALPFPHTALFISDGPNSSTSMPCSANIWVTTPLASATDIAVFTFLLK